MGWSGVEWGGGGVVALPWLHTWSFGRTALLGHGNRIKISPISRRFPSSTDSGVPALPPESTVNTHTALPWKEIDLIGAGSLYCSSFMVM